MMRKSIVFAVLALGLTSCSKQEVTFVSENATEAVTEYSILDEATVSSTDLLDAATEAIEGVDVTSTAALRDSYLKAEGTMEGTDTRLAPILYKTVRITYTTRDEQNRDVEASALIVYPLLRKMSKVMLINHGTHMGIAMVPTKYTSVEAIMAASGALCILPDYIGVGETSWHKDLYLNAEVHGRTSTDALFALLSYASRKKLSLDRNFQTYILGYSQGGSVSLATLRHIQTLPKSRQNELHLKKVICGDGPYDLQCTFESFVEDERNGKPMGLGTVIPTVINSMFNSYPEEMGRYRYEDFFTEWALSTGVPQAIRDNRETLYDMMLRFNNAKLSEILNMDYVNANRNAYDTLLAMMDRQNLCTGWKPAYPLQFFHCNPDGIVSYRNFENAYAGLKNQYVLTPDTPSAKALSGSALLQHIYGMTVMVENVLSGKYY